ncbi:LysR substrate-binding domain-containing protein [Bradyrhizobium sp. Ash2021]|uniref:LysR substrate-binding domain-containing protein n=1 Tax=Bradyrhizobium sp. Ash2021 TaxID=2954771 RepID=UPI0028164A19|nr:LysR substrate-binding domain-containing protein [Bradyrhizobium sp. Ash2021]WMT76329.1 LysR substrate-binding domain-containing protein [Bradyrhizobium sp. Ash2021]
MIEKDLVELREAHGNGGHLLEVTEPRSHPGPLEVRPVRLSDLAKCRLILPSRSNGLRRKIEAAFRRLKIKPQVLEIDSHPAMLDLVRNGDGYTIVPSCALAEHAIDKLWNSPVSRLSITWSIAVQENRTQSLIVRTVGDIIRKRLACWAGASDTAHLLVKCRN